MEPTKSDRRKRKLRIKDAEKRLGMTYKDSEAQA
jgi:hypothetical protein